MATDDAEAAFAAIFDEHRPAVYAYLLGRLGDRELARDLLQETFLRVWRQLAEIRALPAGRRRAWIFTVAKNLTTDTYRATGTRQTVQQALERAAPTAAPGHDQPEARAETSERVGEVAAAVRTLPEELRVVLTMHAVGELTSAQIGVALDQPPGTVRYKLALARKQLTTILEA